MYLLRRVHKVKSGTVPQAARLIYEIAKRYEDAGQRSSVRVYWSGYTVPGPANTVYMEWVQEKLESPYRKENSSPDISDLAAQLREIQEDTHIEFYEMYQDR